MNDSLSTELAQIIEQAAASAASPNDILAAVEADLGALYEAAELKQDQPTMLAISAAWQSTNALAQTAHNAQAFVAASTAIAQQAVAQRDAALGELNELVRDMERLDTRNEHVAELIGTVTERVYEDAEEMVLDSLYSGGASIVLDPSVELWESLANCPGIKRDEMPEACDCGLFYAYLMEADQLQPAEARELIAFIKDFTSRVHARQSAEYDARWATPEAATS